MARRALGDDIPVDVQVNLGGAEHLCQQAKELGQHSDQVFSRALTLRRRAAKSLRSHGLSQYDIAYLLRVDRSSVNKLLSDPIRSSWMDLGHAPPRSLPRGEPAAFAESIDTAVVTVVTVERRPDGKWDYSYDDHHGTAATLGRCVARLRILPGLADAEIVVEPSPASELRGLCEDAVRMSTEARTLDLATFHARLRAAQQLQSRGIGYRDIGDLLDLHVHRVRRLLTHSELQSPSEH